MDFYYTTSLPDESYYYNQIPYDRGYHESYYYSPVQPSVSFSSYEFFPAQPLVAYSAWPESYTNSVSTEYAVHHSGAEVDDDLNHVEYDLHPFAGGYDIVQTYGKPLPPGEEICYPRSTPLNPASASPGKPPGPPLREKVEDLKAETQVREEQEEDVVTEVEEEVDTEEEEEVDTEEDDDEGDDRSSNGEPDDGFDERTAGSVQVYGGVDPPTVNQVPPGYGLEAFDLCENLFGYWPCLSRVNKKCSCCGREIWDKGEGDADKWKRTADYLFGSPDPYRGWADQNGYAYQMRYQQPPSNLHYQADQYGQISWSE